MKSIKKVFGLKQLLILNYSLLIFSSCSIQQKISRSANHSVLKDSSLVNAHIGISIYEPASGKYWYNYNGEKYFVPASNTKLPTCYAAMKYLGDSLVGLRYGIPEESRPFIVFEPTADPTFLHDDYKRQPVFDFLFQKITKEKLYPGLLDNNWIEQWGSGWSWNDYHETYMAERNVFPIFGNVINIKLRKPEERFFIDSASSRKFLSGIFKTQSHYFDTLLNNNLPRLGRDAFMRKYPFISVDRKMDDITFYVRFSKDSFVSKEIPFVTNGSRSTLNILQDSLKTVFTTVFETPKSNIYEWMPEGGYISNVTINKWKKIHSQPTDSLLKPMMHRSDNFFAEQSLLMVSNELLGVMNDEKIIDTLLKTDFKDLPQKPRWVDGSGLSRYNLFTPQDFVAILNKMKNEFGMNRIKEILPTGGEGTINNYYKTDSGYIYAKTGTLSGVVALSGFLTTKKNKQLIFSVLVNNQNNSSSTGVRRAIEKFIQGLRDNY